MFKDWHWSLSGVYRAMASLLQIIPMIPILIVVYNVHVSEQSMFRTSSTGQMFLFTYVMLFCAILDKSKPKNDPISNTLFPSLMYYSATSHLWP